MHALCETFRRSSTVVQVGKRCCCCCCCFCCYCCCCCWHYHCWCYCFLSVAQVLLLYLLSSFFPLLLVSPLMSVIHSSQSNTSPHSSPPLLPLPPIHQLTHTHTHTHTGRPRPRRRRQVPAVSHTAPNEGNIPPLPILPQLNLVSNEEPDEDGCYNFTVCPPANSTQSCHVEWNRSTVLVQ